MQNRGFQKPKNAQPWLDTFNLWSGSIDQIQSQYGIGVASYFKVLKIVLLVNLYPALASVVLYWSKYEVWQSQRNTTFSTSARDIILGVGDYGDFIHYDTFPNMSAKSSMPIIYCSLAILVLIISALQVSYYGHGACTTAVHYENQLSMLVLFGYDHSVERRKTAQLQRNSIRSQIEENLDNEYRLTGRGKRVTITIICWIVFSSILASACYLVMYMGQFDTDINDRLHWKIDNHRDFSFFLPLVTAITGTLLSRLVRVFYLIETNSALHTVVVYLTRLLLIRIGLLITFVFGILKHRTNILSGDSSEVCWEATLGKDIYKLCVFQFLIQLGFDVFIFDFFIGLLTRLFGTRKLDFDIESNSSDVIHLCCLTWIGFYFCPIIPVLPLLLSVLLFYSKWITVACAVSPPKQHINQPLIPMILIIAISSVFLVIILLLLLILSSFIPSCGPFENMDNPLESFKNLEWSGSHVLSKIVELLTSTGFLFFVAFSLFGYMLMIKTQAKGRQTEIIRLRSMLKRIKDRNL